MYHTILTSLAVACLAGLLVTVLSWAGVFAVKSCGEGCYEARRIGDGVSGVSPLALGGVDRAAVVARLDTVTGDDDRAGDR